MGAADWRFLTARCPRPQPQPSLGDRRKSCARRPQPAAGHHASRNGERIVPDNNSPDNYGDEARRAAISPFYAHIARLRHIKRWSLMRNAIDEDVAQHSWEVAVLAHALAVIARDVFGQRVDPNAVAARALFHDATEAITGDLPTPVKHSAALRAATAHLEGQVCDQLLGLLPPGMAPAMREVMDPQHTGAPEWALVKAADRLSALLKCRAELRAGNPEFSQAAQQIEAKIEQTMTDEMRYFMETFAPAFDWTLDSLMAAE